MMEEPIEGMLSAHEARVLGCLMEKQMTTPDYYPLTLKALTTACNQKSSRVPVMNLTTSEIGGVVNGLRGMGLVTARMDGRADRFEQHLSRKLSLSTRERAVLCVLMLRSALTLNEIRINTGRMVSFDSSDELQVLLQSLMDRDKPLLVRIPRAAGQREDRYAHLLCGEQYIDAAHKADVCTTAGSTNSEQDRGDDRMIQLEKDVADLKKEVQRLSQLFALTED
ncbi:MAG: YceH family protein [Mariprofundus sp.]|nr:YceH family protein [Mariprofundus sp.]